MKELVYRKKIFHDLEYYSRKFLKIRTKSGQITPLKFNSAQKYIHQKLNEQKKRTGKVRAVILKGRQMGCSTYVSGRYYHITTHDIGMRTFILTHEIEATNNLFEIVTRFNDHMLPNLKPHAGKSNRKELVFDMLDSGYRVGTAGSKGVGRSGTIQLFHGCLSSDTFILDEKDNLICMDQFNLGDMIRTHNGNIAPISAISRQIKNAYCITLKGMGQLPLEATADHQFLTENGWCKLDKMETGQCLLFPVATVNSDFDSWLFRLPDAIRPQGGGTQETGPDKIKPSYSLGRILGLYLAEGIIKKQYKSKIPSAVTFAVHENEVERTEKWLSEIDFLFASQTTLAQKKSKTVTVTAYGKSFATFVLKLCGELDDKRLPENWRSCGNDFIKGLIHGYLSGDGCSSKREYDRRISAPSIRPAITIGMRDALASIGYGWASIAYHPGRYRYDKICKPIWTLRLSGIGVDRLCKELNWTMPERRRFGNYGSIEIKNGYAHIPVLEIDDIGEIEVMDFEIDHPDHSYCTVQCATHNSEIAFWPHAKEHMAGIIQSIADKPGTEIILESTANGMGNIFHKFWQQAEVGASRYQAIFVPWYWQKEYFVEPESGFAPTDEEKKYMQAYELNFGQIAWRRQKIIELGDALLFKQEYPATAAEAFQMTGIESFIGTDAILAARKRQVPISARQAVIAGFDPARDGNDRDSFIYRAGPCAFGLKYLPFKNFGERVNFCIEVLKKDDPYITKLFIDYGGSGWELGGLLTEAGYKERIKVVNFGSAAMNKNAYVNKRAEIYGEMKKWLIDDDIPACIPDSDSLHADLQATGYSYDSKSRLKLERKAEIKKRGLRSPDGADALALTFSFPIRTMTVKAKPLPVESYF